jgi:hypothetical protein
MIVYMSSRIRSSVGRGLAGWQHMVWADVDLHSTFYSKLTPDAALAPLAVFTCVSAALRRSATLSAAEAVGLVKASHMAFESLEHERIVSVRPVIHHWALINNNSITCGAAWVELGQDTSVYVCMYV